MSILEVTPELRSEIRKIVRQARASHEARAAMTAYCETPTQAAWQTVIDAMADVFAASDRGQIATHRDKVLAALTEVEQAELAERMR